MTLENMSPYTLQDALPESSVDFQLQLPDCRKEVCDDNVYTFTNQMVQIK